MRRASVLVLSTLAVLCVAPPGLRAQTAAGGELALLFTYRPHAGEGARFDAGYRRHLEWHRERGDRLAWLGWYAVIGERRGLFVDGTFGVAARAIDERVDPAGDRADFAENVQPFATPVGSSVLRLRPDLGTARTLEDGAPTRALRVVTLEVEPGSAARFEAWAAGERERLLGVSPSSAWTWYEVVAGGRHPTYLLMVPLGGFADLDGTPVPRFEEFDELRTASSEVWLYRPDLSLLSDPPIEEER